MKPSKISIFTQDGKKLADEIATADCLKPYSELPKKIEWKKPIQVHKQRIHQSIL